MEHNTPAAPGDTRAPAGAAQPIEVGSYYNRVFQSALKSRARGVWAGAFLGLAIGGGIGAAAMSLYALLSGAAIALSSIGTGALVTSVAGMGMGVATMADVGPAAGAVATGLAEHEARMKKLLHDAGLLRAQDVYGRMDQGVHTTTKEIADPQEVNIRSKNFNEMVNWKVLLMGALTGAALGMLLIGGGPLAAFALGIGIKGYLGGALLMGGMGATFGFNMPVIANRAVNFMGDFLSGKLFGSQPEPAAAPRLFPVQAASRFPGPAADIRDPAAYMPPSWEDRLHYRPAAPGLLRQ